MDIETYLWKHRLTVTEFARQLGVMRATVSTYVNRTRKPQMKTAKKIEEVTRGEVTVEEMLSNRYTSDSTENFVDFSNKKGKDSLFDLHL